MMTNPIDMLWLRLGHGRVMFSGLSRGSSGYPHLATPNQTMDRASASVTQGHAYILDVAHRACSNRVAA
jgi:hypothetical protein